MTALAPTFPIYLVKELHQDTRIIDSARRTACCRIDNPDNRWNDRIDRKESNLTAIYFTRPVTGLVFADTVFSPGIARKNRGDGRVTE